MFRPAVFFLSLLISTQAQAQSNKHFQKFQQDYIKFINKDIEAVKIDMPDYRLLKAVEDFEPRLNATLEYETLPDPSGAIATLHDIHSGEPLQSCQTPCILNMASGREYNVTYYKLGHVPRIIPMSSDDLKYKTIPWRLGVNMFEAYQKGFKCYRDFARQKSKPDQDAKPCYRAGPIVPSGTNESGYCFVRLDVNKFGRPENIDAYFCTHENFKANSEAIAVTWSYTPKIERGQAVTQTGVETKLTYRITDKAGALLKGPPGAMPRPDEKPALSGK